jgi:hypothetical protein
MGNAIFETTLEKDSDVNVGIYVFRTKDPSYHK